MGKSQNNEAIRFARMEAVCNQIRSEMDDVMLSAYVRAVDEQDEVRAAEMARKIRNRMLDKSDAEMSLDRIGLDTSSTTSFLTSLKSIFDNQWAKYRQHLRDVPTQEGFPFDIDWGVAPDDNKESEV